MKKTRRHLEEIHAHNGTAYTLGLLMGILTRLSNHDYDLYKELEARAEQARRLKQ